MDIRTPEELAVVNSFLVALGRDVSTGRDGRAAENGKDGREGAGGGGSGLFFDSTSLAQLGLDGMPGIGWSAAGTNGGGGGGGGAAAAYVRHVDAGGSGMYDQQHWTTSASTQSLSRPAPVHKFEIDTSGVYPPFPPNTHISTPDAPIPRYAQQHMQHHPIHHAQQFFTGAPSTPSSSSVGGGLGDRDSPPHDGGTGSVGGGGGGHSPDMGHRYLYGNTAAHLQLPGGGQQVPPLHAQRYPSHFQGGELDYDFGEFGFGMKRGQPLAPPTLAPLEHVGMRYENLVRLKSVPGSSERDGERREKLVEKEKLYPSLPSFGKVVVAAALDQSPDEMDGEKDDTLSTLRTSGNPEFKLPALRLPGDSSGSGLGMHGNPLLRPHYRSPSPSISSAQSSPSLQPTRVSTPPTSRPSTSGSASARSGTPTALSSSRYPALPPVLPCIAAITGRARDVDMDGGEMELEKGLSRIVIRRKVGVEEEDEMEVDEVRSDTPTLAPAHTDAEERKRHMLLVRDLLVHVNAQYRARYGTPPPPPLSIPRLATPVPLSPSSPRRTRMERGRDVEMVGA